MNFLVKPVKESTNVLCPIKVIPTFCTCYGKMIPT